ncbi:unnamed protein product, partial [Ilex paraguariensis]
LGFRRNRTPTRGYKPSHLSRQKESPNCCTGGCMGIFGDCKGPFSPSEVYRSRKSLRTSRQSMPESG